MVINFAFVLVVFKPHRGSEGFEPAAVCVAGPESTPRTLSSRMLVAGFWFFCSIIMANYTANLAAFLTTSRLTTPINSLTVSHLVTDFTFVNSQFITSGLTTPINSLTVSHLVNDTIFVNKQLITSRIITSINSLTVSHLVNDTTFVNSQLITS